MNCFRRIENYLLAQHPGFEIHTNHFVPPLLVDPKHTHKYYKVELFMGLTFNIVFFFLSLMYIMPSMLFIEKWDISMGVLFIQTFMIIVSIQPKYVIQREFLKITTLATVREQRQKQHSIFASNAFMLNFHLSTALILIYFFSTVYIFISLYYWPFNYYQKYLIVWILVFIGRICISFKRYKFFFGDIVVSSRQIKDYDVPSILLNQEMIEAHPRLKNDTECVICKDNMNVGELIVEFTCQGRHCYHKECIYNWMKIKPNCPSCSSYVFTYDIIAPLTDN